ncbi:MAG: acyltransferase family protein, partial [Burkholderiaceae bacterium]
MTQRIDEIDGIRGWAAFIVLLFHFLWELFGHIHPEIRSPYTKFLTDGPLAVYVFFLLSGDVLTAPKIANPASPSFDRTVLKRYFRLAGPILASCLVVYILMQLGWIFNREAALLVESPKWLGGFLDFEPGLFAMIYYGLAGVFFAHDNSQSYNAFLWPMAVELAGSMLIFAFAYALAGPKRARIAVVVAGFVIAFLSVRYYALFFAGMLFAILRHEGFFSRIQASSWSYLAPLAVIAVAALDGISYGMYADIKAAAPAVKAAADEVVLRDPAIMEPAYALKSWLIAQAPDKIRTLFAMVLVFAIYSNRHMLNFFRNPVSAYLGRVSFPVYLIHFAVLVSFASFMVVRFAEQVRSSLAFCLFVATLCIAVSLLAAQIFYL